MGKEGERGGRLCSLNVTPERHQRREFMGYGEASGRKSGECGHSLHTVSFILTRLSLSEDVTTNPCSSTGWGRVVGKLEKALRVLLT